VSCQVKSSCYDVLHFLIYLIIINQSTGTANIVVVLLLLSSSDDDDFGFASKKNLFWVVCILTAAKIAGLCCQTAGTGVMFLVIQQKAAHSFLGLRLRGAGVCLDRPPRYGQGLVLRRRRPNANVVAPTNTGRIRRHVTVRYGTPAKNADDGRPWAVGGIHT